MTLATEAMLLLPPWSGSFRKAWRRRARETAAKLPVHIQDLEVWQLDVIFPACHFGRSLPNAKECRLIARDGAGLKLSKPRGRPTDLGSNRQALSCGGGVQPTLRSPGGPEAVFFFWGWCASAHSSQRREGWGFRRAGHSRPQ